MLALLVALLTSKDSQVTPESDLNLIQATLTDVLSMIDRVLTYVRRVLSGEIVGDKTVGKLLLDALSTSTKGFEKGFNAHLQDTLMMNYLANLLRSQVELSSRMALVS
jgi:translation initiation factor 3 subunit F